MTLHDHYFVQCHFYYADMTGKKYGCAVLAGGAGSRMGHINKADLEYRGKTFAETVTDEVSRTGLPCFLSVANYEQAVPAGWTPVRDFVTGQKGEYIGPMGGICSCLMKARDDGLEGLFFAPCDAPFYSAEAAAALRKYIADDTEAVLWRTSDGKIQTTFGWYSVRCIPAMTEDIAGAKYKILRMLDSIRYSVVDTAEAGLDDRIFSNINRPDDYLKLSRDTERTHILICGARQTGKTTVIGKVTQALTVPVYGYRTRIFREDADGISRVYMYPAAGSELHRGQDNYIGSTRGRVLDINTDTFDLLGTELIRSAKADGILVMDEIGFMERDAAEFRRAVREAFDGNIHILAAIKDTDKFSEHIEEIKDHPEAEIIMLTEENRDRIAEEVKQTVKAWEQEITGRREADHD